MHITVRSGAIVTLSLAVAGVWTKGSLAPLSSNRTSATYAVPSAGVIRICRIVFEAVWDGLYPGEAQGSYDKLVRDLACAYMAGVANEGGVIDLDALVASIETFMRPCPHAHVVRTESGVVAVVEPE